MIGGGRGCGAGTDERRGRMADIRVERKSGGRAWLWIVLVVVLLIVAALLLDRAGYIDLPIDTESLGAVPAWTAELASVTAVVHLEEA
jgi:hypothetical protein